MEKTISVRRTTITFSIWDLGGQREFVNMLPLVCNDAVAILFMFDLSRKSTLNSVKEWYRQARGFNKVGNAYFTCHPSTHPFPQTAIPFLIGTKYDTFATFPKDEQEEITKQVRDRDPHVQKRIAQPQTQRRNALQKLCTRPLSSVPLKPRSTCRRYSRSYSPKPLI
jgi:GTPase SAR1 family protein